MIEYVIEDKDGDQYVLNDSGITSPGRESLTPGSDDFEYDTNTVPNSFLQGSVKIGSIRLMKKIIEFTLSRANEDDSAYRAEVNNLIAKLEKVKYLIDNTNSRRILVTLIGVNILYDPGSLHHSSEESFTLLCLEPFWEDLEETIQQENIVAGTPNLISFTNNGYLELLPIFTFVVTAFCQTVSVTIGGQSIKIEDPIFGTTNNEEMVVDNKEGIIINNNLDRTERIVDGLGFINIPVGASTIEVLMSVTAVLNISYRERYYV